MWRPSEATNQRLWYTLAGVGLGCSLTLHLVGVWPGPSLGIAVGCYLLVVGMLINDEQADDS